jgi:RimJ/RimL family protein N-acetyltransferase
LLTGKGITVELRGVLPNDLAYFFQLQLDPEANNMAAFTAVDPTDKVEFLGHWNRILDDEYIVKNTILYNGEIVGNISKFEQFGETEVSYWIGKEHWGRGIATQALMKFLSIIQERPLYARAAKDNFGSIRVLEKCGFTIFGEDEGFSNARGKIVEEFIFKLEK